MKATRIALVLTVLVAVGCAKDATAPGPTIAKIEAVSPLQVQGTVGKPVSERPTVVVRDQTGAPVAGARVVFSSVFANSTLKGNDVLTDAAGRATIGEWILSTAAGTNVIRAAAGFVTIEFSAVGAAGPPASLRKVSGDNQVAFPGSTLFVAQRVMVTDDFENPVAGVTVSFAVTAGGGSLPAGSAISGPDGIASISGWTLGYEEVQSLSASVAGVPPVSFNASAATNACANIPILASGEPALGDLSALGCVLDDGRPSNLFAFKVKERAAYEFELTAETFSAVLNVSTPDGIPIAQTTTGNTRVILTPGDYFLRVTPKNVGEGGRFRLASRAASEAVSNCRETFLMLGIRTAQALEKGDCEPQRGYYADYYFIYLAANQKVNVTMASTEVDNVLEISDDRGRFVNGTHETGNYNGIVGARVVFSAPASGYYKIVATTDYFSGPYVLIVEEAKP
jgi:hypothetical protein